MTSLLRQFLTTILSNLRAMLYVFSYFFNSLFFCLSLKDASEDELSLLRVLEFIFYTIIANGETQNRYEFLLGKLFALLSPLKFYRNH